MRLLVICAVLSLFLDVSTAQTLIAVSFSDSGCTFVTSDPQQSTSGVCTYSSAFGSYYLLTDQGTSVSYKFNCSDSSCTSCSVSSSGQYGTCTLINTGVYAEALKVNTAVSIVATAYSDSACTQVIAGGSPTSISGTCTYSPVFGSDYEVADVGNNKIAYGFNCGSSDSCSSCAVYGVGQYNTCTKLSSSVYAMATQRTSSSASTVSVSFLLLLLLTIAVLLAAVLLY